MEGGVTLSLTKYLFRSGLQQSAMAIPWSQLRSDCWSVIVLQYTSLGCHGGCSNLETVARVHVALVAMWTDARAALTSLTNLSLLRGMLSLKIEDLHLLGKLSGNTVALSKCTSRSWSCPCE